MTRGTIATLVASASAPYGTAGQSARHFARGKLAGDPIFAQVLRLGPLAGHGHILDLGCGQGLMAAWLYAALDLHRTGAWPADWPAPPRPTQYLGIDRSAAAIRQARSALPPSVHLLAADIRTAPLSPADAVLLIDVLHYMPYADQESLLRRSLGCLQPGGVLLLRVGDASEGLAFHSSYWVDLLVAHLRGHHLRRLYCRSMGHWRGLLEGLGCTCQTLPLGPEPAWGQGLANTLLLARPSSIP